MRVFTVLAGVLLSMCCVATQANPLKDLVSTRGTSTIKYERAVAKRAEFAHLSAEGPAAGVAVTVVDDGGTGAGEKVAAAYLEGLRKVMPQSGPLATWNGPPPQFVARIALSAQEGRAGQAAKMIEGAQGTTCHQTGKETMHCQEISNAPVAMGKTTATSVNPELTVMIRLYRQDPQDGDAAPVVVFEDLYSMSYIASECQDPGAGAASVARLLGESALSSRALSIDFPTTTRALGCNARR